nr:hypothetical protein [Paenibacillus farraposensis]
MLRRHEIQDADWERIQDLLPSENRQPDIEDDLVGIDSNSSDSKQVRTSTTASNERGLSIPWASGPSGQSLSSVSALDRVMLLNETPCIIRFIRAKL